MLEKNSKLTHLTYQTKFEVSLLLAIYFKMFIMTWWIIKQINENFKFEKCLVVNKEVKNKYIILSLKPIMEGIRAQSSQGFTTKQLYTALETVCKPVSLCL
jgi:hypothetical protein